MTTQTVPANHKPRMRYIGRTQYTVESRTRVGHIHHVDTYQLTCSCEAGRYGKRCWAIAAALQFEAWRRHEEAKAQAERLAARRAAVAPSPAAHPNSADFHKTAGYQGLAECF